MTMRRALAALVALLLAILTGAVPAGAQPVAPGGVTLEQGPDGPALVWDSPGPLRIGGARPEFRLDGELLGHPREDGDRLRLSLGDLRAAVPPERLAAVEVWSSGRRLDGAASLRPRAQALPFADVGPTPAIDLDPARPGPFPVVRTSYELPGIEIAPFPEPVEVLAEVTRPRLAPGRRPLALFLHGRHGTCYQGGPEGIESGAWPCPPGWQPIPSHLGYRHLTDLAASQGWIAVSISANGINGQDFAADDGGAAARSELIRHHLALWEEWDRTGDGPVRGVRGGVDLERVAIVGHSRGGEGASRAAVDTPVDAPYRIRGLVLIGPTAFGRQVRPDVPSATLLPTCDGDVYDLQGQHYVDDSRDLADSTALRTAVVSIGTNHNYFNTEWTPGLAAAPAFDDWFDPLDPTCGSDAGSVRLTAEEQQRVGAAYTMAMLRLSTRDDRRMLPLLDGSWVRPESIGRADVGVAAVGGDARLLFAPGGGEPAARDGMTATTCAGYALDPEGAGLYSPCAPGRSLEALPHWQPQYLAETKPSDLALELTWNAAGAMVDLPAASGDLRRFDAIDVRVAADPDLDPAALALRLRDMAGATVTLPVEPPAVAGWPGTDVLDRVHARTLRGDLAAARDLDLRRVAAVELVGAEPAGHAWVLDVRATRARLPDPAELDLPLVSVGTVVAPEPPAGQQATVEVPLTVRGAIDQPAELWVQVNDPVSGGTGFPLVLPPGSTGATVPVTITGDDVFRPYADEVEVVVSALRQALTGDYVGEVEVADDDPIPLLTVDAATVSGTEGDAVRWTFRLSASPADPLYYGLVAAPGPDGTTALDTDDLPPEFLRDVYGIEPPDPAVPLSDIGFFVLLFFDPGVQEATVEIPLLADGVAESEEQVTLTTETLEPDDPTLPEPLTLTGIVPAN